MQLNLLNHNQSYSPVKTVTAVSLTIVFFFTILITVFIVSSLLNQSIITPIDTSANQILNQINLDDIDSELKILLSSSYNIPSQDLSQVKAVIRNDSITYTTDNHNNLTHATFLIVARV